MALIKCVECGKDISDTVKSCPHCGMKVKKVKDNQDSGSKNKKIIIIVVSVVLVLVIGLLWYYFNYVKEDRVLQSNYRDESVKQVMVITDYINIREEEDVNSNLLGKVYKDEIYTVLDENIDSKYHWIYIETMNGIRGYISGDSAYVSMLDVKTSDDNSDDTSSSKDGNTNTNTNTGSGNTNSKPSGNKPSTSKPNNSNNNSSSTNTGNNNNNNNNSNNNNSNNNNNNTGSGSTSTEPVLKACLKTCDDGYELKNEDSVDCYCEKKKVTYVKKNQVVYDKDGVKITVKGLNYETKRGDKVALELFIENSSSVDKTIQPRSVYSYVNGYRMAHLTFSTVLLPNTRSNASLEWFKDGSYGLDQYNIETISKIQVEFSIIDWDGKGVPSSNKRVYSGNINLSF